MKTGRPTFQLDAKRLRSVREEAKLTQAALARLAHLSLNKPEATADTATKHYQKIERTGRTSKAMAEALAQALGTTVATLQGEAPDRAPDWINNLERQLRDQLATGGNPVLQAALERESEAGDPVRHLAVKISESLARAQLGPQQEMLTRFVELTGWSEAQLMQSVSLYDHWFLMSSVNGVRRSATVSGFEEMLHQLLESGTECAKVDESDVIISLREELPWLHVEIQPMQFPGKRCVFSLVRCMPTQSGLQWVNPTWRNRPWLDESLLSWAYKNANFVVGFDGHAVPRDVRDVRALRLLVERSSRDQHEHRVAVIKGDLEDLPDDILGNFQREGRSHDLATNWISAGLWEALAPFLSDWPADRWTVRFDACVVITLNPSISWGGWTGRPPDFSVYYSLRLVEEVDAGEWRPAPWRASSVEVIAKRLRLSLSEEADRIRTAT